VPTRNEREHVFAPVAFVRIMMMMIIIAVLIMTVKMILEAMMVLSLRQSQW